MKYIKDFFYSLSDLFIILLILGLAGGLIYWRFGIIMNYPEALAAEIRENGANGLLPDEIANTETSAEGDEGSENNEDESSEAESENSQESGEGSDNEENSESSSAENSESGSENNNESGSEETSESGTTIDAPTEHEPGSGPRDNTIWKDGKLRVDISINLSDCTPEDAVALLVQAGLFASEEDFAAVCANIGKDPTQIAAYEYNFSAGFSQNDIADYVTLTPGADD